MAGTWTKNWRAFRNIMLMGSHHNGLSTLRKPDGAAVNDLYSSLVYASSPLGTYSNETLQYSSTNYVRVGTGDTAPAATDYNLAAAASISYLSCATGAPVYDDNLGTVTRTITLAVQNQNSASVTIKEWGIFGTLHTLGYANPPEASVLLYREVLDSPVTLAQYQAATLELTVNLTLTDPVS